MFCLRQVEGRPSRSRSRWQTRTRNQAVSSPKRLIPEDATCRKRLTRR